MCVWRAWEGGWVGAATISDVMGTLCTRVESVALGGSSKLLDASVRDMQKKKRSDCGQDCRARTRYRGRMPLHQGNRSPVRNTASSNPWFL